MRERERERETAREREGGDVGIDSPIKTTVYRYMHSFITFATICSGLSFTIKI